MAILLTNTDGSYATECAICNKQLTKPVFATTHFIADENDLLYRYSDAGMHWDCYANWKYQRRFANQYFEAARQWKARNAHWPIIAETDAFFISANPNLPEPQAHIDIRAIGPGFRVSICEWTNWVNGGWDGSCVHGLERIAIREIEASVRQLVPDSLTLMALAQRNLKSG